MQKEKKWYQRTWAIVLMVVVGLMIIGRFSKNEDKVAVTSNAPVSTTATSITSAPSEKVDNTPAAPEYNTWNYSERVNEMTSKKTKTAYIDAEDLLDFEFPYQGGSTATLSIRRDGGVDSYIRVSKGQFNTTYDGTSVRVRFDDRPQMTFSMLESSDGSSDILFFSNTTRLIQNIKKSKVMKVQAEFFNEGNRVMEFHVGDLKW